MSEKRCVCPEEECVCDYKAELKSRGLKYSRHRAAILRFLESADQPADAEQIYINLNENDLSVSLSTVYRSLESLCGAGLAAKLMLKAGNKALYEINNSVHRHHLVCINCKRVTSIESCPLGDYEQRLARETGFAITGHRLDIYGYCKDCKKHCKSFL